MPTLDQLSSKMPPYVADKHFQVLIPGAYMGMSPMQDLPVTIKSKKMLTCFPFKSTRLPYKNRFAMENSFVEIDGYPYSQLTL